MKELKEEGLVLEILELFPRQGKWTEKDYFNLPETNRKVELSEGKLIIAPSPTSKHQEISGNLYFLIRSFNQTQKLGEVRYSPLDVRLQKDKIRQPDIIFMSNEHKDRIIERYWGVPDLAVEIISKGSEETDRIEKFAEYEKAGVSEYWIVDPLDRTIEIYIIDNKKYKMIGKWGLGEIIHSEVLSGFQASVDDIFSE
ncbi:Uma2 family endonuclease [Candidatus Poribacteria bacterium]|nr:Uma2 family endonuclease [Candidatus Poribacteria bacterium]